MMLIYFSGRKLKIYICIYNTYICNGERNEEAEGYPTWRSIHRSEVEGWIVRGSETESLEIQ